jgi:hypothetical protein
VIYRRYDGRNWTLLYTLADQLQLGFIKEEDLEPLSDEVKGDLKRIIAFREEQNRD